MKITKSERKNLKHYFKLVDMLEGYQTICYCDNIASIRKEAYAYSEDCDDECILICKRYNVTTVDGKFKGVLTAEYNPYTGKKEWEA